jgi:hypothetical protein
MATIGDTFKPGDKVPNSGIYEALHDRTHPNHQVTCFFEEPFPPCNQCGHEVRFRLAVAAVHVRSHENFVR